MKILVTGAAGFLGSHLVDRLLRDGHWVLGLDNLSTGRKENLHAAYRTGHFVFITGDVRESDNPAAMALLGGKNPLTTIFNLACPASPKHYQADPLGTITTSFLGALRVAELARRTGARVIHTSTSEVYGDPQEHPQKETYWGHVNPIGKRACYDEGKRAAEALLMDAHREWGIDVRIARLFNTYGPRMAVDDGRVVSNFVVAALRGQPLELHGDGTQTRSLCYVDDTVDGLVKLATVAVPPTPVNIGNPVEISMGALAGLVSRLVGRPNDIIHAPAPPDDPQRRRPNIDLAELALGWRPLTPLHEGLAKTIEHFRATLGAP